MNLESIEQRVLMYLEQASNPLVRIEVLYAHLADHSLADNISMAQLREFLSRHESIRVLDPPTQAFDSPADEPAGSYAIAKDRVPSQTQLMQMMSEQLDILLGALRTAREEALARGDSVRLSKIDEAQRQAVVLRDKLSTNRPPNVVDFRNN